jgi:hypothetical protein
VLTYIHMHTCIYTYVHKHLSVMCIHAYIHVFQEGSGLLFEACKEGHLGDIEYLQSMGGKELLMTTDSVSEVYGRTDMDQ